MDVRGVYWFSSLLKQKIKAKNKKNLLRHLQRRNFFFKKIYVMKCLRSKKRKSALSISSCVHRVCLLLQDLLQSCARGGGGEWRTCAMRYDEPRLVWTRLTTTH